MKKRKVSAKFIVISLLIAVLAFAVLWETLSSNITGQSVSENSLAAHYTLDGNLEDSSGNNFNGECADLLCPSAENGEIESAYYFNGSNSINLGELTFTEGTDRLSVGLWVKKGEPLNAGSTQLINKDRSGFLQWRIIRDIYGRFSFSIHNGTAIYSATSEKFDNGEWHHVVGVYNSTALMIYVDGVLRGSTLASGKIRDNYNHVVCIGGEAHNCNNPAAAKFIGSIDEVRIYNYALSGSQVTSLYSSNDEGTAKTYSKCVDMKCVAVSGEGSNECSDDSGCVFLEEENETEIILEENETEILGENITNITETNLTGNTSIQDCVPEYSCELKPERCPESGIQTKVCKDVKCGDRDYLQEIGCLYGACSGCEIEDDCYPFGYRISVSGNYAYCDYDSSINGGILRSQKMGNDVCENGFECRSNLCVDNVCIERGLFSKFLEWLKSFFG